MQTEKRQRYNEQLKNSRIYRTTQNVSTFLDRYYLDGVAGLIPGGIGDIATAIFSLFHVYLSAFRLRSAPLTLAILNNTLRDVLLGLIPFYVGDVIDFFHRANKKNMGLIDGFLNNDETIIHEVNSKAKQALIVFFCFVFAIFLMIRLLIWLASELGTIIFN